VFIVIFTRYLLHARLILTSTPQVKRENWHRKLMEFSKAWRPNVNPGSLAPELFLLSAQPYLAHLASGEINEQLYQQTKSHLPREFSMLCLLIPKLPALCLWSSFWLPGHQGLALIGMKNIGEAWHCPHLWLQAHRLSGGAARSKAILTISLQTRDPIFEAWSFSQ
jgi:hypothetical protein